MTRVQAPLPTQLLLLRLQRLDVDLRLGATPLGCFFSVTLPLIMPGVVSGAIFAFVISFDEVVVALFIASPETFTLPKQLFTWLRDQLNPSIVAIATLLIAVSIVLMIVVELLRWRSRRLLGSAR